VGCLVAMTRLDPVDLVTHAVEGHPPDSVAPSRQRGTFPTKESGQEGCMSRGWKRIAWTRHH
jgi:hypothetical protein